MLRQNKYHVIISGSNTKTNFRSISNPKHHPNSPNTHKKSINSSFVSPKLSNQSESFVEENPRYPTKLSPLSKKLYEGSEISKPQSSFLKFNNERVLSRYDFLLSPKMPSSPKELISLKKAMKNRDWLIRAKENISREISLCINASNGICMIPQECIFKYYLGKGNNSALVKQIMGTRWWWTCVEEDQLPNVNMVWTQHTNLEYLSTITVTYYKPNEPNSNSVKCIRCNVPYETETLEKLKVDISSLGYDLITTSPSFISYKELKNQSPMFFRTHNKLEKNFYLSDKKFLYFVMKKYYETINIDPFKHLPMTFHVECVESKEFENFVKVYQGYELGSLHKNLWIIKPAENSNRGNGITVSDDIHFITDYIKNDKDSHTYIIQKYIEKPFLINKRKFDIRLYTLMTSVNGVIQLYFYKEGYLRTACKEFTLKCLDNKFIHLTNDAIQKHADDYGRFEHGNKLSYSDFQRYLENRGMTKNFFNDILPEIKNIVKDTVKASFLRIDNKRRWHSFEIFGYDFILDSSLKPWLLEVNTNPCLELSSSILVRIIPAMIENALKIAVDPIFPEPMNVPKRAQGSFFQELIPENKFELIFHEHYDGKNFIDYLNKTNKLESFLNEG